MYLLHFLKRFWAFCLVSSLFFYASTDRTIHSKGDNYNRFFTSFGKGGKRELEMCLCQETAGKDEPLQKTPMLQPLPHSKLESRTTPWKGRFNSFLIVLQFLKNVSKNLL
ncbi:hypothetical protein TNIN_80951 [Trichonephila inaurata madagascariensis]|uniref:Secreted protein n=1 Tax=Trichonephila inaurata madagascariensis TaxID=2747483 RepID=A0A8X6X6E8_9ARAC|nr:hypothetical protein TNIN_80951 [Trichonephila inaurata madagascariensis]